MKFILLFLLVAFCYAAPKTATVPYVSFGEDGTITITADGKKVVISKAIGTPGQKNIEITVPDPLGTSRTIKINQDFNVKTVKIDDPASGIWNQVDETRYKRSPVAKTAKETTKTPLTQMEILDQIFKDYQGAVDLKSFEKVLKEIDGYVKTGELDSTIYDVLKGFAQYEALNPEDSYAGASYSRLAHLQSFLNKIFPVPNNAWPSYGPNPETFQQYGDFYAPVQGQQAVPVPYQQQIPLPQQQPPVPQQQLSIAQQLALHQSQLAPKQPFFVPQQQYYPLPTQFTQGKQITPPNYQPPQQFDTKAGQLPQTQQGYLWNPVQQQPWSQPQVSPLQQNLNGQLWPLFKQQFVPQPSTAGQSYTPVGYPWQRFWAPVTPQKQYPVV